MDHRGRLCADPDCRSKHPWGSWGESTPERPDRRRWPMRGHGLMCLLGCRYPYWHGKNYRPGGEDQDGDPDYVPGQLAP